MSIRKRRKISFFIFLCAILYNKYKTFLPYRYIVISTLVEIGKTRNCENSPPFGRRFSTQFLVLPISTRVDITVYQHGKCFIFVKLNKERESNLKFLK